MSEVAVTKQAIAEDLRRIGIETFAQRHIPSVIKNQTIFLKFFYCEAHKFHFERLF